MRPTDWLDTDDPMDRIKAYNAQRAANRRIKCIAAMLHVLLYLAQKADLDGTNTFPSVAKICARTGLSASTVHRALRYLVAVGLTEADKDPSSPVWHQLPGNHRPVAYRLLYGADFQARVDAYQAGGKRRGHLAAV